MVKAIERNRRENEWNGEMKSLKSLTTHRHLINEIYATDEVRRREVGKIKTTTKEHDN